MAGLLVQLAALDAHLTSQAPPDLVQLYTEGVAEMLATNAGEAAIAPGEEAPAFALTARDGTRVSLADQLKNGPVVLLFFRGGWCPFCQLQLKAMNESLPLIAKAGAVLLAVTPETPESASKSLGELSLGFPVLHDGGAQVAASYGLVFKLNAKLQDLQAALGVPLDQTNGSASQDLPVPAVLVVDPSGRVAWRHVDRDYRLKRAEPDHILKALENIANG